MCSNASAFDSDGSAVRALGPAVLAQWRRTVSASCKARSPRAIATIGNPTSVLVQSRPEAPGAHSPRTQTLVGRVPQIDTDEDCPVGLEGSRRLEREVAPGKPFSMENEYVRVRASPCAAGLRST